MLCTRSELTDIILTYSPQSIDAAKNKLTDTQTTDFDTGWRQ
jgi:hypothetical protein